MLHVTRNLLEQIIHVSQGATLNNNNKKKKEKKFHNNDGYILMNFQNLFYFCSKGIKAPPCIHHSMD